MKLYTEEQVRKAIAMGYDWCHQKHIPDDFMIDNFIQSVSQIQVPNEDQQMDQAFIYSSQFGPHCDPAGYNDEQVHKLHGFMDGAKWMEEQLKQRQ